ncbi:MAG: Stp1/IreP family PP2C-type Ser/Thr phosphatase [Bacillota bacterium]|jgi:serine/threonine protein phosphatase PrpC|nr:Stp1/IreP family PP2C-type Ser/Thr phosphatase [Bacillota bacterium]MDI9415413.1 Stp1/IreP family PP2C-type Ser/Thr phosphatase [Bacillota bacterium]NLD13040.1 Stp1/IreP family PP2C-type Ser/Thr phosphatase [Bacillota bacterium]HAV21326.1 Stp1/IreP family PP2C-type Ser/Thr phosphatase [Bacillota bacterium]HOB88150.1 Stp1/IreP family PP2C-type Ser/Thr phosphatase [Bacillota bacterium]
MEASARSDIGLVRAVNEDSFLVTDVLFAVADGLGGHEAGEVASRMAIDLLEEHLPYFRSNPADKLRETFTRINTAIHQRSMSDENCKGMGTTLTALLIQDGTAYIGHVGDSRAYLVRDNVIYQLTEDHSVVGELVRLGLLTKGEAKTHPQRHLLTRAIGTLPEVDIEIVNSKIEPGDRFILCTDGLSEAIEDSGILDVVTSNQTPPQVVDELINLANRNGGHDNVTVIAVFVGAET